jgi:hypothetical protein
MDWFWSVWAVSCERIPAPEASIRGETHVHSTIVRRFAAAISVSTLALTLGSAPSSAAETSQPFITTSKAAEGHRDGRLATGADLQGNSKSSARATSSSSTSAAAVVDIMRFQVYSTELHDPDFNYIDFDIYLDSDGEDIEALDVNLTLGGKAKGSFPVYFDEEEGVFYVEVRGDIGLGGANFTGSTITYTEESGLTPTVDPTDSNHFYVRRGRYEEASAAYSRSASGNTKTFKVNAMGIYSPSLGDYRALSSIKLQYKTSDGWKTKKTLYPDVDGNASYTFVKSTRYYYRVISSLTTTWVGFKYQTPKI